MTFDVAVVGGGIVGAACAFACARSGLSVVLVEQQSPLGGATAAAMGHIVVMDASAAQFALTRYSRDLWNELAPELPENAKSVACGTVWVAADEEEMEELNRKQRSYATGGVAAELLDAPQLQEAEPNLRADLPGALLVPGDSVTDPLCVTDYLSAQPGIKLKIGRASRITEGLLHLASGTTISAGAIINAAGLAASDLCPGIETKIQPRKGHLLLAASLPGFLRHQLVELGYNKSAHLGPADSVAFNVQPRRDGQVLIGSSRQFGASPTTMDQPILSAMLRRAVAYMPALGNLPAVGSWVGFRPASADNLPLIGPCPGYRNVYLAAGHEGLGITTSLATGRLIADMILGRESAIPCSPYLPERML